MNEVSHRTRGRSVTLTDAGVVYLVINDESSLKNTRLKMKLSTWSKSSRSKSVKKRNTPKMIVVQDMIRTENFM